MDVPDDEAVPESLHGIAENVAADCLDDVLHEFRTEGFYAFPFLRAADTFIGDGFASELIDANPGLLEFMGGAHVIIMVSTYSEEG